MAFTLNPVPPPPDKLLPSLSRSKPTTMPSSYKAVKRDRHSPPPIASGSKSAGSPLNRVASTDSRRFHMSFVAFPKNCNAACARVFTERRFLALLIEYTLWDDLYALASTCRQFRHIMREPELKDVILSRFIPGYQYGLQNRDPQRFQDVEASIRELHLLSESCSWCAIKMEKYEPGTQCSHSESPSTNIQCTRTPSSPARRLKPRITRT